MHIVANVLFALAGIVGLPPALALLTFWYRFPSWLDDLSKYETLLGALMFAATLALIGVAITSWNQRSLSNRQIAAERRKQELALRPEKQEIRSAFIGEIDVIVNELHHESLISAIENAIRALETGTGKVEIDGVHIRKHIGKFFDHSPAEFILLPSTISTGLTRFYAIVRETDADLEWCSRAVDAYANQRVRLMSARQMIRLLRKILDRIDLLSGLRRTLVEGLKEIHDTDCLPGSRSRLSRFLSLSQRAGWHGDRK
jgi:hypothetical protein